MCLTNQLTLTGFTQLIKLLAWNYITKILHPLSYSCPLHWSHGMQDQPLTWWSCHRWLWRTLVAVGVWPAPTAPPQHAHPPAGGGVSGPALSPPTLRSPCCLLARAHHSSKHCALPGLKWNNQTVQFSSSFCFVLFSFVFCCCCCCSCCFVCLFF